jgi:hypothetical protein
VAHHQTSMVLVVALFWLEAKDQVAMEQEVDKEA